MIDIRDWKPKDDGESDCTPAIAAAIRAACDNPAQASWKDSRVLESVFIPSAKYGWMLGDQLVIPEGVILKGDDVSASRLWLTADNWTPTQPKIRNFQWDYAGTTQQFGTQSLTFMLHPKDMARLSRLQNVAVMDYRRGVEFWVQDCRFVMHAHPQGIGDGITGIRMQDCGDVRISGNTFDLGQIGVQAIKGRAFGIRGSFITGANIFHRQAVAGIDLSHSDDNILSPNKFMLGRVPGAVAIRQSDCRDNVTVPNIVRAA